MQKTFAEKTDILTVETFYVNIEYEIRTFLGHAKICFLSMPFLFGDFDIQSFISNLLVQRRDSRHPIHRLQYALVYALE